MNINALMQRCKFTLIINYLKIGSIISKHNFSIQYLLSLFAVKWDSTNSKLSSHE